MKKFHTSELAAKPNHTCLTRLYIAVLFPISVMEPGSGNNCEVSTVIGADLWLCWHGQTQLMPLITAPFMLYLSAEVFFLGERSSPAADIMPLLSELTSAALPFNPCTMAAEVLWATEPLCNNRQCSGAGSPPDPDIMVNTPMGKVLRGAPLIFHIDGASELAANWRCICGWCVEEDAK